MNQKYKYLIKNTGLLTISNFSSKILVFLLLPLYTSVLNAEEYGLYDLMNSTIQLMMPILTVNIIDAIMRFSLNKNNSRKNIISIGIKYILYSIIILGVILLLNNYFSFWNELDDYSLVIFIFYISFTINQFAIQTAKGLENVKEMAIAGVLGTVSTIIFNLIFLLLIPLGLNGFFIANILGQAIPAIYIIIKLNIVSYLTLKLNKTIEREMLKYSIPLISNTLGWWINGVSDRYVVTYFCGIAANGLYSVAYKIPSIISTFQNIFIQAWQISAIKEYENNNVSEFYKSSFQYLNAMMCLVCTGLILFTKPISYILYAKDFYYAWEFVPLLLVSSVFNAASGFVGPILLAQNKSILMAKSAIYGAIINVVMNFLLVYFLDVQGAAIATALSSFAIYYFRKRNINNLLNGREYNLIMFSWVLIVIQAILMIYLDNIIIQVLIVILIILIYYKPLLKLAKKFHFIKKY